MFEPTELDYCKKNCFFGSEGHCGRTEGEYMVHCEKLYRENKLQRGKHTLDSKNPYAFK